MTKRAWKMLAALLVFALCSFLYIRYTKGAVSGDIAYGDDPLQMLDVYAGSNCPADGCTVLVAVHGGGWSGGDKADFYHSGVAANLARHGMVVVVPNYRLSPKVVHPAHVQDVAAAIAWSFANVQRWGGNPQRTYLLGHSAGAHLVALVGTNPFYLQEHGLSLANIKGVVSLDTSSLDLERRVRVWGSDDDMRTTAFPAGSERNASPVWNVRAGTQYPAFLLLAASNSSESIAHAGVMGAKLAEVSGKGEVAVMPYDGPDGSSHIRIFTDLDDDDKPVTQKILSFINSY